MKKLLLSIFLVQFTSAALAIDWGEYVTSTDRGRYYIDAGTAKKSGNFVSFFVLNSLYRADINEQGKKYLSTVSLFEFNCQNRTARNVMASDYSGSMGKGDMVGGSNIKTNWQPATQGSTLDSLLFLACRNW